MACAERRPSSGLRRTLVARVAGVAVSAVLSVVGCAEAELEIVLVAGDDLAAPPEFLRLVFQPQGGEALGTAPFSLTSLGDQFVEIPPNTPFTLDVIGCPAVDFESCQEPDAFVARGCAGPFNRQRDERLRVEVTLFGPVTGNGICPVAFD